MTFVNCDWLHKWCNNLGNSLHTYIYKIHFESITTRVEPETRLKRVSGKDKALLPSTSIIRVIRVNICARIE